MQLHLISHSPFSSTSPVKHAIANNDAVLLIGDGCYHLQNPNTLQLLLKNTLAEQVQLLALSEDCALRGLSEHLNSNGDITPCTIDDFVTISLSAQHILNW